MVCEAWKTKLDTYLDGELAAEDMRAFDTHVSTCASCATDALTKLQIKRAIRTAGIRFTPKCRISQTDSRASRQNRDEAASGSGG